MMKDLQSLPGKRPGITRAMLEREWSIWMTLNPDLVVIAPSEGPPDQQRFEYVSPSWTQVLGWTPDELTSHPWMDLIHPEDKDATTVESVKMAGPHPHVVRHFVNRYRHKTPAPNGDARWVWLSWNAISDTEVNKIYGTARDITDIKNREAALQTANHELVSLNADLQQFTRAAAHQLKSPPRSILGLIDAVLEDDGPHLSQGSLDMLQIVRNDAVTMAEVVDGLSRLSRIREQGDLEHDVILALEFLASAFQAHPMAEQIQLTCPRETLLLGDASLLREAFVNLVDNAFKFNDNPEQDKRVWITVSSPLAATPGMSTPLPSGQRVAMVQVADNGIGVPDPVKHKLFQMFQRVHPERPGSGVGLALVSTIVARHNGVIQHAHNPGGGSVFAMILPAATMNCRNRECPDVAIDCGVHKPCFESRRREGRGAEFTPVSMLIPSKLTQRAKQVLRSPTPDNQMAYLPRPTTPESQGSYTPKVPAPGDPTVEQVKK